MLHSAPNARPLVAVEKRFFPRFKKKIIFPGAQEGHMFAHVGATQASSPAFFLG